MFSPFVVPTQIDPLSFIIGVVCSVLNLDEEMDIGSSASKEKLVSSAVFLSITSKPCCLVVTKRESLLFKR